ncbi:MAG: PucR family transcriptional regulator, partial [Acidimicrobiales bacterium]
KIYDSIHAAVATGDPRAFHARLERELSCELYVVDAETLAPVLEGTPSLPPALSDRVRDEISAMGGAIPGALHFVGARDDEIAIVEVPYDEPTLLVARVPGRQAYDLVLLQHAATAVAVEVAHSSQHADYQRQVGTELLSQLIDGRLDEAAGASQLARQGISPSSCRLFAIGGCDATGERRLHVGLRRRRMAHVLLRRDRVVFLLLRCDVAAAAEVSTFASSLVRARLGDGCTVGVSDSLGDSLRAPAASREALWALASATSATPIVAYGEASPLPALQSPEEAHALVGRILGSLLAYDLDNGTDLVHSLATFLATQRSWQRCAAALHVHRQTVIYRMRRVEQLTGRSLSETGDIAILWLALSAREILRLGGKSSLVGVVGEPSGRPASGE